jgi:hypothetical protein
MMSRRDVINKIIKILVALKRLLVTFRALVAAGKPRAAFLATNGLAAKPADQT